MKLFLETETEKETEFGTEKSISTIKEVSTKADAIKDKPIGKKCYLHICNHDKKDKSGNYLPCKREVI